MDSNEDIGVNARQIRAARALLGWSREEAARRCGVGMATLNRMEREIRTRDSSASQVVATFETQGIVFFNDARGVGVALRTAGG